jgi:hypothetical protein
MTEAYKAICELWASPEYQEKSENQSKSGAYFGKHMFGGDGYIYLCQQMVNPCI